MVFAGEADCEMSVKKTMPELNHFGRRWAAKEQKVEAEERRGGGWANWRECGSR